MFVLFTHPTSSTIFSAVPAVFAIFAGVAVFCAGAFSASSVVGCGSYCC